ncbi:TonB-dependent receptor [Adhaeribacter aerolatus]|uniref:TonB-dependent receptor n=1 Tax=Adhaeribacter aerolatus TaxID=670289 RepID=A0A512B5X2_9BACT|nr:TonB-dependent receptor plug domain-containing protein [Adhaeribacter aerolatus]GEO07354.1 TonB-dependent receptor [Adhaeribacter aerolatus]
MKNLVLCLLALVCTTIAYGQNTLTAYIKDAETQAPLIGAIAIIQNVANGATSDVSGKIIINNIPDGLQTIRFSYVGYTENKQAILFPRITTDPITILLEEDEAELEAVEITSTRSTRTIRDISTRVEFIAGEELEEKGNMKPGDIRMILSESTGIQTQQTSPTSANASIRIQGLDGRYTQLLKDGFPLYSGYAGGLGLLQTPPLDLKQVEVIKGSASTLYGGGAIAGLVNLISKTPQEEQELRFLLNGTTAGGLDVNGFYGKRFDKIGVTVFAARNSNAAYDPSDTDLSAIPQFSRYTINPRLFFYPTERTQINLGVNTVWEDRLGGDIHYIKGERNENHRYFEQNKTQRFSTQLAINHQLKNTGQITLKNSISYFKRRLNLPEYNFTGNQVSTFSEANYTRSGETAEWVTGLNVVTNQFQEVRLAPTPLRDYTQTTFGAFIQNSLKANTWLNIETGLRGDYVLDYGFALLPRISALFKISPNLTSRLGGGLGYKAPSIFTEETERLQYRGVLPVNATTNKLERSYGANWDFTYRTAFINEAVSFSINHLFFYTYLNYPLMLFSTGSGLYQLRNIPGHIDTKGTETNIKIGYQDLNLFLGYTFTNTKVHANGVKTTNPLTPKHRLNTVLMYEVEDKWKLGLEAYYFSKQRLSDGTTGKSYVITGFMAEKLWEKFSLYANFENFLDARQTRFDTIYTGNIANPVFRDIYAPLDGFVINGGIKIRL